MPFQRIRPALPQLMFDCSALPTSPIGGAAAHVNVADFAGRQTQLGEAAFLGDELDRCAGGAGHLGAATRTQFHCVDNGTDRDVAQRQVVAGLDVSAGAGLNEVTLLEACSGR